MIRTTLYLAAFLGACGGSTPAPNPPARPPREAAAPARDAPPSPWVTRTLDSLSLREKAGQMVMVWSSGASPAANPEEMARLTRWVRDEAVGGVIISTGTPAAYVAKLNALQRAARVPLLVTTDLESGPGMRLVRDRASGEGGGTVLPPLMGLGAAGSDSLAYAVGRVIGEEGRAAGIALNLAPVLDVNSNPDNPIINTRSFGEDPAAVARLGVAYVRGLRAGGMLAAGKHFPGHGDTRTDSHISLPTVSASRARLDSVDLVPFRAAIAAGVDAILVGHIAVPSIAEQPEVPPASLSPRLTRGLLRGELGFRGVVFTDAMNMGALTQRYSQAEAVLRAVRAGADILLQPPDPAAAIETIAAAVRDGRIPEARLDSSVLRILAAKERAGLNRNALVDEAALRRVLGSEANRALARTVARRSITLVRDERSLVPLGPPPRRILSLTYTDAGNGAMSGLEATLRGAGYTVRAERASAGTGTAEFARLTRAAADVDVVLVSVSVIPRQGRGSVAVAPRFARFVEDLARSGRPVVVVSFGNPYLLPSFPSVPAYLLAWEGCAVCQRAAGEALVGSAPITGRLPVSLPPRYRVGWGITRPARGGR